MKTIPPTFRFAPSPTGALHLGHAYSALLNEKLAREVDGTLLLRIEDTDQTRCRPEFTQNIFDDMSWLGIEFGSDVRIQSEHRSDYAQALQRLKSMGVLYACDCSRQQREHRTITARDPEGQPLYDGVCKSRVVGHDHALRLDMAKAVALTGALTMVEQGEVITCNPAAWGDVVLARRDTGTSYHLSVVVDDGLQGVTHIVRGEELLLQTSIHRVLQKLLNMPEPHYHHHLLRRDVSGRKLSKSDGDQSLKSLRDGGVTAAALRKRLGF